MNAGMWVEHCGGEMTWVPSVAFELVPWEAEPEAEPEAVAA